MPRSGYCIQRAVDSMVGRGLAFDSEVTLKRAKFGSPIPVRACKKTEQKRSNMVRSAVPFQNSRLFTYVLAAIAMSGYDAVATMQHIGRGVAAEGNPLMASLIHQNAVLFFLVKMSVTAFGLLICYNFSHLRTARLGIKLVVGIYLCLCVYHGMILMFG
jgi:hypothetical protein